MPLTPVLDIWNLQSMQEEVAARRDFTQESFSSCLQIINSLRFIAPLPSGMYTVRAPRGQTISVFCDMTTEVSTGIASLHFTRKNQMGNLDW